MWDEIDKNAIQHASGVEYTASVSTNIIQNAVCVNVIKKLTSIRLHIRIHIGHSYIPSGYGYY